MVLPVFFAIFFYSSKRFRYSSMCIEREKSTQGTAGEIKRRRGSFFYSLEVILRFKRRKNGIFGVEIDFFDRSGVVVGDVTKFFCGSCKCLGIFLLKS